MRWLVGSLLVFTLAAAGVARELPRPLASDADDVTAGFFELVPAARLPTTEDEDQRIEVWLKVPAGAKISAEPSSSRDAPTLLFPPGTVARRVERVRVADGWAIVDVRGTEIVEGGAQRYHVLLPSDGEHARLLGVEWRRGGGVDEDAAERVVSIARDAPVDAHGRARDRAGLERLRRLNACSSCHAVDAPSGGETGRPTDLSGFFVPLAVVEHETPVPDHRSRDVNADDPYVSIRCEAGEPRLEVDGKQRRWRCEDGALPLLRRDVEAGLASGDDYTERLCASRRALWDRMDPIARHAFGAAFAACGIER